jgi:hypothetical protein
MLPLVNVHHDPEFIAQNAVIFVPVLQRSFIAALLGA